MNGKFDGTGKFTWGPDSYFEGIFSSGQMTGAGKYYLGDAGGLYDNGKFYPNKDDLSVSFDAVFDGVTMK